MLLHPAALGEQFLSRAAEEWAAEARTTNQCKGLHSSRGKLPKLTLFFSQLPARHKAVSHSAPFSCRSLDLLSTPLYFRHISSRTSACHANLLFLYPQITVSSRSRFLLFSFPHLTSYFLFFISSPEHLTRTYIILLTSYLFVSKPDTFLPTVSFCSISFFHFLAFSLYGRKMDQGNVMTFPSSLRLRGSVSIYLL